MTANVSFEPSSASDKHKLVTEEFNRLRGQLAGLIESWGVKESQERGAISTMKTLTYTSEKRFKDLLDD